MEGFVLLHFDGDKNNKIIHAIEDLPGWSFPYGSWCLPMSTADLSINWLWQTCSIVFAFKCDNLLVDRVITRCDSRWSLSIAWSANYFHVVVGYILLGFILLVRKQFSVYDYQLNCEVGWQSLVSTPGWWLIGGLPPKSWYRKKMKKERYRPMKKLGVYESWVNILACGYSMDTLDGTFETNQLTSSQSGEHW